MNIVNFAALEGTVTGLKTRKLEAERVLEAAQRQLTASTINLLVGAASRAAHAAVAAERDALSAQVIAETVLTLGPRATKAAAPIPGVGSTSPALAHARSQGEIERAYLCLVHAFEKEVGCPFPSKESLKETWIPAK